MQFMTTIRRPALVIAMLAASTLPNAMTAQPANAQVDPAPKLRHLYGTLVGVDLVSSTISFQRRNGRIVVLDVSQAVSLQQLGALPLNKPVSIWGVRGPDKHFHVQSIGHAAPIRSEWGDDNDTGD